jgi:Fic family protein
MNDIDRLEDTSILPVLVQLGPDFTAREWAERLDVTLDQILLALKMLGPAIRVRPEPLATEKARKLDQAGAIVEAIERGNYTAKQIAAYTGYHPQTIRQKLSLLRSQGIVQRYGNGPTSRWMIG